VAKDIVLVVSIRGTISIKVVVAVLVSYSSTKFFPKTMKIILMEMDKGPIQDQKCEISQLF